MLTDARGVTSLPFVKLDVQVKTLLAPVVLDEDDHEGAAVELPGIGDVLAIQETGAIASSGSLAGSIQESADGLTEWATLHTFAAAGADNIQKAVVTTTQPFVRYIGTVSGEGGTVAASATLVY